MKKTLLTACVAFLLGMPVIKAQQPSEIYMATWVTMQDLGKPINPDSNDPKLIFNSETECYEGEVIDWPRLGVNPYNAKIPYSVTDGVVTYYGVVGPTQQFIFNTTPSSSFQFTVSTDPSGFKGFGLSTANNNSIEDVKVSINLSTSTITFTQFESGSGSVLPELVSVDPESGTKITPDEDGGTEIIITFSGKVTSMDVISEDSTLYPTSNEDGTVWTIPVTARVIENSMAENHGLLLIKIQKVYADNLPVGFPGGNSVLTLEYPIEDKNGGVEQITDSAMGWKVYSVEGVPVLTTDRKSELDFLHPGIYIINGKKVLVK